ncbi:uncharacterized protein BYT42DRAFT_560069 [Radiomyces spectabilis]|uniref:uncharacterized protein n=1 Tax=Radiomyces spectabilis TaxID=64574 RepID=UPI00221EBE63|nr:uncharacterized protein BYT42DRAFT_560069 [Radiomyces spectabilis]KAI8388432.1 hypothetical protein BYT42DRAFT_560069 [Radiomyces spectabilis]
MVDDKETLSTADDFANYIDSVIGQLQSKMDGVSKQMNEKFDSMNTRIDELERTLKDVLKQAEESQSNHTAEIPNKQE